MALAPFPNRRGRVLMPIDQHMIGVSTVQGATINAVGESYASLGRVYLSSGPGTSKTISAAGGGRILWRTSSSVIFANAATNFRVGIQDINGTTFLEDGTYDVRADLVPGTETITATSLIDTTMETGTKTIADGDQIAVVLEMTARGGTDAIGVQSTNFDTGMPYATVDTGAGPAKGVIAPMITLLFDDGTVGWMGGDSFAWLASISTTFGSGSTPDEVGLLMKFPWQVVTAAARMRLSNVQTTDDFDVVLYEDPLGTPSALETVSFDVSNFFSVNGVQEQMVDIKWASEHTLAKDTYYLLALKPTTVNVLSYYRINVGGNAYRPVTDLGTNWSLATRTDGSGAFTPDTSIFPAFGLYLSQFQDGTDGGSPGGSPGSPGGSPTMDESSYAFVG